MRKHLIYYAYPVAGNGVWQKNLGQLIERIDTFGGERIICISARSGFCTPHHGRVPYRVESPLAVMDYVKGHDFKTIILQNDETLGEVSGLIPMMERVKKDSSGITFYAHTKGTTHLVNSSVSKHIWASLLYAGCLDYMPLVEEQLSRYHMTGCFKTIGHVPGYNVKWHYSGTFFWFQNAETFRRKWQDIPQIYGGVEAWPGVVYEQHETGCVFHEEPLPAVPTGYVFDRLRGVMKQFVEWSDKHASIRRPGASPKPWLKWHGYE